MSERMIAAFIAMAWMFIGSVLTLGTIWLIVRNAARPVRYTRPPAREIEP